MKLDLEKIKEICTGAVRIEHDGEGVRFYRFTEKQDELYKERNAVYHLKSLSSAGVRLSFRTDSKTLAIRGCAMEGSSRYYYSIDIFVNGKPAGYIDNFSSVELARAYWNVSLPLGAFSGEVALGEGEKEVTVYLPWSVSTRIDELAIDDGAYLCAAKPQKILLAFGDSITHGYDALRPSNRYTSRLCDELGAFEVNKAIGGEVFWPGLAGEADDLSPDYITVAYGTNDWNVMSREKFKENCREFFVALCKNYPAAKIFAITPIWRKDYNEERKYGDFLLVDSDIREMLSDLDVVVIGGFDLVPKDENYFGDLRLHPNDAGFDHYFKNLLAEIKKYI